MKMKLFANIISIQNEKHQITNRRFLNDSCVCRALCRAGSGRSGTWGRFEQTFKGPSEGNPFTDVQLKAAFWRTDTTDTLRIDGFL